MLAFLLPLASKIIKDAVAKIPENEELGEKMVEICLIILAKAVKLTKTDICLLYTSPSPRDLSTSRMPSSA